MPPTRRAPPAPAPRRSSSAGWPARTSATRRRPARSGERRTDGVLLLRTPSDLRAEPGQRVVLAVHHALLERDDAVVGEVDALGAHLAAALGDVAVAQAELLLGGVAPVDDVQRVHVELGQPDEEPRPGERRLVLLVVTDHVAGVLAEVALDALAELLRALDVHLLHAVVAVR